MGQDKARLELLGQPLIARAVTALGAAGLEAAIAGGAADLASFAPLVPDRQSGLGPLSGICSALAACPTEYALFLPVDLPLFPAELLRMLVEHAVRQQAAVTLCTRDGLVESLPVVLKRAALGALEAVLASSRRSCQRGFATAAQALGQRLELLAVESCSVTPSDAEIWFMNLNTPEEFERAVQHLERRIA